MTGILPSDSQRQRRNQSARREDDLIFEPDAKVLFIACVTGATTGGGVVALNTLIHVVEHCTRGTVGFSSAGWIDRIPTITFSTTADEALFVPIFGGVVVCLLQYLRSLHRGRGRKEGGEGEHKKRIEPVIDALSAAITLGTGSSLGPEGPSVDIGKSLAKGFQYTIPKRYLTALVAAGSAAGISAGFNAPLTGVFFALETVLEKADKSKTNSLSNDSALNLAVVTLAAVIAAIVSQIGLGSEPAFEIPQYSLGTYLDFPLYLVLGFLSGGVSLTFTKAVAFADDKIKDNVFLPREVLPVLGGVAMGCIALCVPEVTYEGFENFNKILRGGDVYTVPILAVICLAKILTTSICKASGLVGGIYAPTLFLGAATGSLYGKLIGDVFSNTQFEDLIAGQQSFALVGMASVLSAACRVPLTSTLLLFELTRDYGIVLPTLGGVALSFLFVSSDNLFALASVETEKNLSDVETDLKLLPPRSTVAEVPKEYTVSQCLRVPSNVEPADLSALLEDYNCSFFVQLDEKNVLPERIVSTQETREMLSTSFNLDQRSLKVFLEEIGVRDFRIVSTDMALSALFSEEEEDDDAFLDQGQGMNLKEGAFVVVVDKNSIPVGVVQKS